MLCSFININNKQLICENCGRKIPYSNNNGISAKCRIPSKLIKRNNPIIPKLDISIGVGDILKELLDKIHIKYDVGCSCNSKLSVLNRKGPEWCQKNIQTIIKWMEEESKEQNIIFAKRSAKALLKLAIKKHKLVNSLI